MGQIEDMKIYTFKEIQNKIISKKDTPEREMSLVTN
jgi:hypothetical protein